MKNMAVLIMLIVLITLRNENRLFAQQSERQNQADFGYSEFEYSGLLWSGFTTYLQKLVDNEEQTRLEDDERGYARFSFPIKPEAKELCIKFNEYGGGLFEGVIGFDGWFIGFYVSIIDFDNNVIILIDTGM